MKIMTEKKLRHLPIISENKLTGIVSIGDVVHHLIKKYELEAEQLRSFISL
jgi:CBS domain-containing protein